MLKITSPFWLALPLLFAGVVSACADDLIQERIDGPVQAEILRVIDGDTLLVSARPWPQQTVEVYVRLRGIDAPELRAKCPEDRVAAQTARARLEDLVRDQHRILLTTISGDKYFGRVLADIVLEDGRNPAQELMSEGVVRAYSDENRRKPVSCSLWN